MYRVAYKKGRLEHVCKILGMTLTWTLALSSSANTSNVTFLALSGTLVSHTEPSATLSEGGTTNSSLSLSLGGGIEIGAKMYDKSTEVEKILSFTSARVVYSSRTKFSNEEPVDLRTVSVWLACYLDLGTRKTLYTPNKSLIPAVTFATSLSLPADASISTLTILFSSPSLIKE